MASLSWSSKGRPPSKALVPMVQSYLVFPKERVAVLVGEDGALEIAIIDGQPNFIDRTKRIRDHASGIERIFEYRYVRTSLVCQTGHRVYVLNEIGSDDLPLDDESITRPGYKQKHGKPSKARSERTHPVVLGPTEEG